MASSQISSTDHESTAADSLRWFIGLLFLVIAAAASGLLLMKEMGVIGITLPGCGEQSACGDLSRGFFGSVPGIGWPTSYLGFTYFIAMLVAWSACWPGVPSIILWIGRLGALFSLLFMIVIFVEWKLCPYCITAHVANFGFWITLECSTRLGGTRRTEGTSMPAFMNLVFSWIIVTALLSVGQAQADHFDSIAREANAQANIDEIVKATMGGGANPLEQAAQETGPGSNPEEGDGIAFTGRRTVVDNPSEFAGRYLYGPQNAPVQIVMVGDYQCPDCRRYEEEIAKILESRDDVSLSVRHFPFNKDCNPHVGRTLHGNACWAARFAETAGILGGEEAFWQAHRMLFEVRGRFTPQEFPGMVQQLGLDPVLFQQIMEGSAVEALIQEDIAIGGQLGVYFTPMIFVNGVQLKWWQIPIQLDVTVDALARAIASGQNDGIIKAPPTTAVKYIEDWRDGPVRQISDPMGVSQGVMSAPNSIVLYADYTDPQTKALHDRIEVLRETYPGIRYDILGIPKNPDCNDNIRPEYRDTFPSSCAAVKAVKAAGKLGGRDAYWGMIEFLMESGQQVTKPEILSTATQLGLDREAFLTMMESQQINAMVQTDILRTKGWRLRSFPSLYVNGKLVPRWKLNDEPIVERVVKLAVTGEE
ncbi:MAG: thioredoxin domain-containing protein [Planctomycetota bacterium]|nr:thioredoxin domain-containing protein [Planctomycetota bacterium]